MRTRSLVMTAALLAAAAPAASKGPEVRWIAYVRAGADAYAGDLVMVRSDGDGEEVLLDGRVLSADVGPGGVGYAAREEAAPPADAPAESHLLRVTIEGEVTTLAGGKGVFHFQVAAGPSGEVAMQRQVTRKRRIPKHLRPAIQALRRTNLPILVPPEQPPDTDGLASDATEDSYYLNFTNDPEGVLSHAEQRNVIVEAMTDQGESAGAGAQLVDVRDTQGEFACGASSCFLSWVEFETRYSVGEFGSPDEAVEFADALVTIEEVAGVTWRDGSPLPLPQLVVRSADGKETILEKVDDFCECGFTPVDWSSDGDQVLAITGGEGYTSLQAYPARGGAPTTLREGSFFEDEGGGILDAAYGPDDVLVLVAGEGGPPGTLETIDRETLIEGVRSFDVGGNLLVYANDGGDVIVRDLTTGDETTVGEDAISVGIGTDDIAAEEESPGPGVEPVGATEEGFPVVLVTLVSLGVLGIGGGGLMLLAARRRRGKSPRRR